MVIYMKPVSDHRTGGDAVNEFEQLLGEHFAPLQRYINYKISKRQDAEDILQEVCLTAAARFETLQDKSAFKAWLIGIAAHKCTDYYRKHACEKYLSLDALPESVLRTGRGTLAVHNAVHDTLDVLEDKDRQILYLYFFRELPQEKIARQLSIPLGTVKSRLHYAKEKFKEHYPYQQTAKGESIMKRLPEVLPAYSIEKADTPPFAIRHEELPGMFIVPRIGEQISFGMYDMPQRIQNGFYTLKVTNSIVLHGISGVAIEQHYSEGNNKEESTVFAQLTDDFCRYLGGISRDENGGQRVTTFLDDDFDINYGIGEDNCGFPVHRRTEGRITESADGLCIPTEQDTSDLVGRFRVTLLGQTYDTVRLIDYQMGNAGGMLCEHYINADGRTILWRRFNKNDWAFSRRGKLWTELLPDNERLTVNGETYVHWYDCITDYIL